MLAVRSVTKRYGSRVTALDNVSFEVDAGQVMAVIGANGAGKTTLIKCIVGLVRFEGEVVAGGIGVSRDGRGVRRLIGYMPQDPAFHSDLTVRETALFYADLKSAPPQRARELVETVGLAAHEEKKVGELSGGMRQRLALAVTLLANPPLLVLDEPASGLDISARLELRQLVQDQRKEGKSILLSTHWLEDVPYVADSALVLNEGKTVFLGPATELAGAAAPSSRLFLRLNGKGPEAAPIIESLANGAVEDTGDWLVVSCPASRKAQIVEALVGAGIGILDFRVEEAPVDSAILQLQKSKGGRP